MTRKLAAHAMLETADDGGMLIDTHTGAMFACNATAWEALARLADGDGVKEVAARLAEIFEIDRDQASDDVDALLVQLQGMGLVDEG